jgi:hypothetical protein
MTRRSALFVAVGFLVVAACSGDDDAVSSTTGGGATTAATTTASGTTSETSTPDTTTVESTTTTTPTEDLEQLMPELGLAEITQLTPVSGGGTRPILEWEPVEGALNYYVAVVDPGGGPYWAWRTGATAVPVGGEPRLDEGAFGPAISEGMAWSVTAVDADGALIAISAMRPISP